MITAAAGVFLLIALYKFRLRQLAAQMNLRLEERVAERTRIARELHDTLIQEMNGLSLQIAALSKFVIAPEAAKDRLGELKRQAEYCLREARQSVWDIRSADANVVDLATALKESGEQLCVGKAIRFVLISEGDQKPIAVSVRQQLLRIGREAIANAVQHAHATQVEVLLMFSKGVLQLKISDDGRGFDLNNTPKAVGHFGLATMRERADQIRAEIQISSTVGKGTCVLVSVRHSE
jgi:signal transduction histidine kinase